MQPVYSTHAEKGGIKKNGLVSRFLYSQKSAPYVFIAPFVASISLFFIYPFVHAFVMSFQEVLPGQTRFVGLENYARMLNPTFVTALLNTTVYTFWTMVVLIPFPLLLAVFLNSKLTRFRNFFKSALFIPALTSVIVAGVIFRLMFGEMDTAFANSLLNSLGFESVEWRRNGAAGMFLMVLLASWRWMGVNILYFLAGLQNIPKEMFEAAEIDGAGTLQKFWNITLPFLKPITVYVLTISIIAGFRMFEESFVFWEINSPGNIGLTVVGYIYKQGFQYNDLGFGSAVGMVVLLIIFMASFINLKLTGALEKEDRQ